MCATEMPDEPARIRSIPEDTNGAWNARRGTGPARTLTGRSTWRPAIMLLLERSEVLAELSRQLALAGGEAGRVVLVRGEAGIGKTSLLRHFAQTRDAAVPVLRGACDPLFTPRLFGPLLDMAPELGTELPDTTAEPGGRLRVFTTVLNALTRRHCLVIIEDVHWADEATLDLVSYLSRRIERTRSLLVLSYRDDEIGSMHPLRRVLGVLSGAGVARVGLAPLSLAAVRELAGTRAIDAVAVHRHTAGNPFYITEVLATGDGGVPATVRDAVLARAARMSSTARGVLDAAAVAGPRVEPWLLEAITLAAAASVEECLDAGMLRGHGDTLEFRHELAREAVLESLSPSRRVALHRGTLQALRAAPQTDAARLAHHADAAGDSSAVLMYAPQAARAALAVEAHRQAHAQYARAVRHADGLPADQLAVLLEAFALECQSVGNLREGTDARQRAATLRERLGDVPAQAVNLCFMGLMLANAGQSTQAGAAIGHALALLEPLPPCRELAFACRCRSFMYMLQRDNREAIEWGRRAIALAEQFNDLLTLASAYNSVGAATIHDDYEAGCRLLERSAALARQAGSEMFYCNAYVNLGSASGEVNRFERAEAYLALAIAHGEEHEMDHSYQRAWRAICLVHLGRWSEAGNLASGVLDGAKERAVAHNMAQLALGRLRARRGDAGVWSALDEALRLALDSGHLQRLAPVRAARAEAAWLDGDRSRCVAEAQAAYGLATARRHAWFVGELGFWLHLAGESIEIPGYAAQPYLLQIAGRWRQAGAAWRDLCCPYEQARALAIGDEAAQREALAMFERLGARPAVEALRDRMQQAGVRGLPRGPRASTREHPFGLTQREVQSLHLLCEGLRNAEIAQRLHRSVRTVDHHLASVFAKLGVDTRAAAIAVAQREGLVPQIGQARGAK